MMMIYTMMYISYDITVIINTLHTLTAAPTKKIALLRHRHISNYHRMALSCSSFLTK